MLHNARYPDCNETKHIENRPCTTRRPRSSYRRCRMERRRPRLRSRFRRGTRGLRHPDKKGRQYRGTRPDQYLWMMSRLLVLSRYLHRPKGSKAGLFLWCFLCMPKPLTGSKKARQDRPKCAWFPVKWNGCSGSQDERTVTFVCAQ